MKVIKQEHITHQAQLGYKHEEKNLVIDYSTKDIVIRIFELYYNGYSYKKISNYLMKKEYYLYLQKLRCPKRNRILGVKATSKKNGKAYFYYYCNDC